MSGENSEGTDFETYNDNIDIKSLPILTRSQLSLYNGEDKSQIYVAIRGYAYDVSENTKSYGPGRSYHKLVGKDVSRLLGLNRLTITGSINNSDNSDNNNSNGNGNGNGEGSESNLKETTWYTDDFTDKENEIVDRWVLFFRKRYKIVGVVVDHDTGTSSIV
ncbi:uncharacterized protein RJT21DRAFT_119326 [Scheffersomyces amazonensis]|uniref:uncharacterized protein n=1 Tax=Scheffersomyces amazonensis TaxID=1078765 RepID=UPI00315DAF22